MVPRTRYGTSSKKALSRNWQHKKCIRTRFMWAQIRLFESLTKIAWIADISRSKSELIKKWNKINRSRLMYAWVLAIRQHPNPTKRKISDERGAEVQSKLSSRTRLYCVRHWQFFARGNCLPLAALHLKVQPNGKFNLCKSSFILINDKIICGDEHKNSLHRYLVVVCEPIAPR